MVFGKPLLLRKSNERPSRLTHDLGLMMGKNTAPAAVSTAILGHHLKKKLAYLTVLPIAKEKLTANLYLSLVYGMF